MSEYPKIAARFARETAGHEMTVLHEDGLYRHLRFATPKGYYAFDLVAWKHKLVITERRNRDLDRALDETVRERDFMESMADKLAYAVAPLEDIGEHSSENCPWQNALELITPAAEVDRLRKENADLEAGLGLNEAA
ncbi:hypothetical protein [Streptomyces sp. NBC_01565]|uniref:hypothetical protein n=1 Tax=Streptomyces sp. NBC_01565 TaxID=2975881 RepID=UPI00224D1A06|nr:hypothetical protein [Streptomyces sp. NBC_01565]MCX4543831.1 hypothetical protein [Streptomyces sp. NBC_01565]